MNDFHNLNTEGWLEFPFSIQDKNFVSKVIPTYALLSVIQAMGVDGFAKINQSAVKELNILSDSYDEMASKLRHINEYASEVVLELVG
jgi:hypothetical protein